MSQHSQVMRMGPHLGENYAHGAVTRVSRKAMPCRLNRNSELLLSPASIRSDAVREVEEDKRGMGTMSRRKGLCEKWGNCLRAGIELQKCIEIRGGK
jgi:hypothetical protein